MSWALLAYYGPPLVASFAASVVLTWIIRWLAYRWQFVDRPQAPRKLHGRSVAYLGGAAIFLSFLAVLPWFVTIDLKISSFILAAALLVILGTIDDRFGLSPFTRLAWQAVAGVIILAGGVGIISITNPLGGVFILDSFDLPLRLGDFVFHLTLLADIFAFVWLLLMINTMNFLDGLDGLAAGVGAIGAFVIFILSLLPIVNQPATATMALILAGCLLGFLLFNFNPASIFLGDGGSTFIGLTLATLAIIANGKIATTLLVLGLPLLDVALVILRRVFIEHKAPWQGDRKHFHHRLLSIGLSQRQSVIVVYIFCSIFGLAALFLGSSQKLLALGIMALAMLGLFATVLYLEHRNHLHARSQQPR